MQVQPQQSCLGVAEFNSIEACQGVQGLNSLAACMATESQLYDDNSLSNLETHCRHTSQWHGMQPKSRRAAAAAAHRDML